jgi:uncharacterized protein (TIGR01244 family)
MSTIRKINDELAVAGQITLDQVFHLVDEGYRTVLNLRSPREDGFIESEQQKVEWLGLHYLNTPMNLKEVNSGDIQIILQQISEIPKPLLLHCDDGVRAAAIALMHVATKQGTALEQALQRTIQLGLIHS